MDARHLLYGMFAFSPDSSISSNGAAERSRKPRPECGQTKILCSRCGSIDGIVQNHTSDRCVQSAERRFAQAHSHRVRIRAGSVTNPRIVDRRANHSNLESDTATAVARHLCAAHRQSTAAAAALATATAATVGPTATATIAVAAGPTTAAAAAVVGANHGLGSIQSHVFGAAVEQFAETASRATVQAGAGVFGLIKSPVNRHEQRTATDRC